MSRRPGFLTVQIEHYLNISNTYQPIWLNHRSVPVTVIPVAITFAVVILCAVSIPIYFLIIPLFFPNHSLASHPNGPYLQILIVFVPLFVPVILGIYLTALRWINKSMRTPITDAEFVQDMHGEQAPLPLIIAVRHTLGGCYCVNGDLIRPNDGARRLAGLGFILHPDLEYFLELLENELEETDGSFIDRLEITDQFVAFNNVGELVRALQKAYKRWEPGYTGCA